MVPSVLDTDRNEARLSRLATEWAASPCLASPGQHELGSFQLQAPPFRAGSLTTMDRLRLYGPMGLRIWLKLNRPLRGPRLRPAAVVEFGRAAHQAPALSGSGSSE